MKRQEMNSRMQNGNKARTRIAIMVDWFYPGYKAGGPIQSCVNLIDAFKDEYDFFVITSDRDLGETTPYQGITTEQWTVYKDNVQVYYADAAALNAAKLKELMKFVHPDFVYLNSMYSFRYTIQPLFLVRNGTIKCPVVLAPRGMLQEGALRQKAFRKKFFLRILRAAGIPGRIIFHATDEQEAKDIKAAFPVNGGITVIPNFPKMADPVPVQVHKKAGELKLIFLSRVAKKKNLLYALECLGELKSGLELQLDIYGEIDGQDYWNTCEKKIGTLPNNIKVSYKGAVPNEKVYDLYKHTHVFILPTLGENFGHAIFEALIAGKPVLISDKTPWRDLDLKKAGFDIDLNNRKKFIEAIEEMAGMNQQQYDEWSAGAKEFARSYQRSGNSKQLYQDLFKGTTTIKY